MFKKIFRRTQTQFYLHLPLEEQQRVLDSLRYNHADDQLMQLHLDRMQTVLNRTR